MGSLPHSSDGNHYPSIPTHSRAPSSLRCCCGRDDCALLEHNNVALEGLEKDLETAAKLGQALLHRHESYMAEAEEDRQRLVDNVDALEREKREMKKENARIIEENRNLLEQLEGMNKAVSESDDHVRSLTLTLENTQAELRRLTIAASRATELESQLAILETEQSKLQDSLMTAQEDEKSAIQRWRNAENTLRGLHDQVERIESEARQERERHEEVVQRMERKRAVERELDSAAVRLKGAAATSELGRKPGTQVVSRFVKDILQDNANLQVGIMELREMLENSNQEVQNLRDQVLSHQPLDGFNDDNEGESTPIATLSEELSAKEERRVSQEFHIHHHYHTPTTSKKDKGTLNRRVKKKRPALGSPVPMHSAVGPHSLRRPFHRSQSSGSSMNTILTQTSVSIPPPSSRRWSMHTPPADSLASSPQSAFRTSSIFDRVDRGYDFSEPTSPDSTVFSSPIMGANHTKGFDSPSRPFSGFDNYEPAPALDGRSDYFNEEGMDRPAFLDLCEGITTHPAIPEESESSSGPYTQGSSNENCSSATVEDVVGLQMPFTPSLRKSASHDSLLSVAGMDIHTPISRQSRMGDWHSGMRIPQKLMSPSVQLVSTPPVISAPTITADRGKGPEKSSLSLLASMAAPKTGSSVTSDSASVASADSSSTTSTATTTDRKSSTLGRRVGGWVLGRWGMAPVSEDPDPESQDRIAAIESALSPEPTTAVPIPKSIIHKPPSQDPPSALSFRFPGVNQKGPIMGLRPPPLAPSSIHPQGIDENLLRESLADHTSSALG